jgi:hypothetical protein
LEEVAVVSRDELSAFPLGATVAQLGGALVTKFGHERVIYPRNADGLTFLGPANQGSSDEA